MTDMVSKACSKRANEQPPWIEETLGRKCVSIETQKKPLPRVPTTSAARMSDRNGLGPHKHVTGPKSFL